MPELSDAQLDQLITDIGLKRPRGGRKYKAIAHGTYRGARQHRYRNEALCDPCRLAENAYQNEMKRNARLRKQARAGGAQ